MIEVHLLTGYLGSGKTSLLRRLLARPDLADTAVLVNEVGEIGLDHLLLETVTDDVVLLKSGCVCCSVRGDLKDAVLRLAERRHRGEIPPFSRLVIETTGLADPTPVVATFAHDPMLRHGARLASVTTVVDAVAGPSNLDRFDEALRQVAAADRIAVTKTDLAPAEEVAALERRLRALNPLARVVRSRADGPLPDGLAGLERGDGPAPVDLPPASARGLAHGDGVRTHLLAAGPPLDWAALALWLGMLLHRHGDRILRLKGLVRVEGCDGPVVVQGVQHVVHEPEHLDRWPADTAPGTRLVVIARDLDGDLLARSFRAFTSAAAAAPGGLSRSA